MPESHGTPPATTNSPREHLSPGQFIRRRRPELFSDSETVARPLLSQATLEYHLDTLTSRKQETEFEYFCRRLCEKEICPNLRPQTGPTGGGDSKADSETFPVSSQISRLWVGVSPDAANERWAFAFSAKKTWASKVRSDVKGIVRTGRDYKRIYFVTNQFARDKARAQEEDKLSKQYGIPVHILDRSWIVKSVLEHDRAQLAIEALGLREITNQIDRKLGPLDVERTRELQTLEAEINDHDRYEGAQYQLAEDCLRAAILARGLGKPRTEVEGMFLRAERIAAQVGHNQQRLRIAYEKVWTVFWWYDDFRELNRLYDVVEQYAGDSTQVDDLGLLLNLWQVLVASVVRGTLDPTIAKLGPRTTRLRDELGRLASDRERPNSALQARTNLLQIALNDALATKNAEKLDELWVQFRKVIVEAEHLGNFPFESSARLLKELGDIVPESDAFDELFEAVVHALECRRSEGEGGVALLERGYQKIKAGKPYDAIRLFGRAADRLIKREYRHELIMALGGCAGAYEEVGLLWAARNAALAAAERCLAYFKEDGRIIRSAATCLRHLLFVELRLGRVPWVLQLTELLSVLIPHLKLDINDARRFDDERKTADIILGLLMLKSSTEQLRQMEVLPDALERLGLFHSKMAMLYALGCVEELRSEGFVPGDQTDTMVDEFFEEWFRQPANEQLPEHPNLIADDTIELRSNVLGCWIVASVSNNPASIFLAEAVLGGLEAFLATSVDTRIAPFREQAHVVIKCSAKGERALEVAIHEDSGESAVEILHSPEIWSQNPEKRAAYKDALQETIIKLMLHIAVIDDPEKYIKRVVGDERGFERALHFSEVNVATENIFGAGSRITLTEWIENRGEPLKRFPLRRAQPWYVKRPCDARIPTKHGPVQFGSGPAPKELVARLEELPHHRRRVQSLVDIPLWDKAKWRGTLYVRAPDFDPPLLLGLAFVDADAGRSIFAAWLKRLGRYDEQNELRVSIITGVDRKNPHAYNVVVGSNPRYDADSPDGGIWMMVSRRNQMTPSSSKNLDDFLAVYRTVGRFVIAPAQYVSPAVQPKIFSQLCIVKQSLNVRPAWQIGENDPDILGVCSDDDPIIPPEVTDAPILAVLKRRKTRGRV